MTQVYLLSDLTVFSNNLLRLSTCDILKFAGVSSRMGIKYELAARSGKQLHTMP
jgi:hypothetical protein